MAPVREHRDQVVEPDGAVEVHVAGRDPDARLELDGVRDEGVGELHRRVVEDGTAQMSDLRLDGEQGLAVLARGIGLPQLRVRRLYMASSPNRRRR